MPKRRTMDNSKSLFKGELGECWNLPSGVGGPHGNGYDKLTVSGVKWYAHRLAYTLFTGPIPDGTEIDHQCHNQDSECLGGDTCLHRKCVNPAHLEAVPHRVNALRGKSPTADNARRTHCPAGHEYIVSERGRRYCPPCRLQGRIAKGETSGNGHWRERTHCPRGHAYDEANTYIERRADGTPKSRMCRTCQRERARARRAERKQK